MIKKGVKPRTHLVIDLLLFAFLVTVAISALMKHIVPPHEVHVRFMFHCLHGVAGIALCFTIGLHLLLHLPWIQIQLRRLFQS